VFVGASWPPGKEENKEKKSAGELFDRVKRHLCKMLQKMHVRNISFQSLSSQVNDRTEGGFNERNPSEASPP